LPAKTKAESGSLALKLCFEELGKMVDSGITEDELARAKKGLVQSLPSLFDTPSATANIFAQSEIWKRDPDHFVRYPKIIESLTREEINTAFKKYFVADSARIVVVGPKEILMKRDEENQVSLENFGRITELTKEEIEKKE
jgi:zinc protease